jgi:hypothetical protein
MNGGCAFHDKIIAEFIECDSKVSLIVRPRRFGKTVNLTMLKEFFSVPIYPDYRHELFRDTKITERSDLFDGHFYKYPVIFLSLKVWCYLLLCTANRFVDLCIFTFLFQGFDGCDTWFNMRDLLCEKLASLYKEHRYINDILDNYEKSRFNKIRSGDLNMGSQ